MKLDRIQRPVALAILGLFFAACNPTAPTSSSSPASTESPASGASDKDYTVGMVLVGPRNDGGWNQAHFEATKFVMEKAPGVKFEYVDKVNPNDRPNVKGSQVADDLIAQGAKFIIFNSDDFKDDALETAKKHPDITVIHASGDYAWKEGKNFKDQKNLGNLMGQMEYGKMIAGCTAALATETGKIGYVGPLIQDETRRLVSAAYLGAKYCWEKYRGKKPEDLKFKVTWIGFWFNIPGVTLDPTKVSDDFYNGGYDVVLSGLDTPEVAVQGKKAASAGKKVKFLHYDLKTGCDLAPEICLGSPYFNWGPSYLDTIQRAKAGQYAGEFVWFKPDWKDLNGAESGVGFSFGQALGKNQQQVETFIKGLGDGSINLFQGPLKFQDGTDFLKAGETATPQQIWYMPQLLQGIDGLSNKSK
ncbi:BMP family ABC transporter substrate-binding protein [Leptolyngbya sp. 'hensonii']|uniref:BMP family lipoprotein n=1 Tax=Leptolyngbya sp. 'hensonii' TaxID=1922337 RepID=UPI00094F64CC|nr:BMP family ABC transporter substrate-binding protein [Leptolyngbya sp. 'hensonii']OLP20011.1 BMP family ABC transporter substrate-binding protein [Leptolyngbya sp. 'hensonii']